MARKTSNDQDAPNTEGVGEKNRYIVKRERLDHDGESYTFGDSILLNSDQADQPAHRRDRSRGAVMDNQHRKIAGYRELTQDDIDLMNRVKAVGAELLALQAALAGRLSTDLEVKQAAAKASKLAPEHESSPECVELRRFLAAEPLRWAAIAKTDIQTGVMALVRAIAQPEGC
ncbi:hypothetical protein QT645_01075 [Pseudomonas aeruginosa]|nr:hypothetical protein [Pseudomonas aeruginosa]MDM4835559.1 hypothetical protein [Pseudomonas aeruginosa]